MIPALVASKILAELLPTDSIISLHTAQPGAMQDESEARPEGYGRQASGAWKIDGTVATNADRIEFPVVRSDAVVTHVAAGDGKQVKAWARLTSPIKLTANSRIQFDAGTLVFGIA